MSSTHCIALFSKDSKTSVLAERLSRVTDVSVVPKDGLSQHICRPCNRKFQAAESLRALTRASYENSRASRPLTGVTGSPKSSPSRTLASVAGSPKSSPSRPLTSVAGIPKSSPSRPLTSVAGIPKSSRVMALRKRSKDTSRVGTTYTPG